MARPNFGRFTSMTVQPAPARNRARAAPYGVWCVNCTLGCTGVSSLGAAYRVLASVEILDESWSRRPPRTLNGAGGRSSRYPEIGKRLALVRA
jgi:hypothetical protein